MASNKDDSDLYGDLYGDEELIVPLDDENSPVTEKAPTSPLTDYASSTAATKPSSSTTSPSATTQASASSVSGSASLPAKPQTAAPGTVSGGGAGSGDSSLSYSAQVAKQFSAYQQTPSQERIQLPPLPDPNAGGSAIETHMGAFKRGAAGDRPLRPSEMKDEG